MQDTREVGRRPASLRTGPAAQIAPPARFSPRSRSDRPLLDPVGSTSWHHRHSAYFRKLDEILRSDGVARPRILVIGPGAVTRIAAPLLNNAGAANLSRMRKLVGDAARYGDQLLRRIPTLPLRSLEPMELREILTMPHDLIVADRSRRVLEAVAAQLPDAQCLLVDITFQDLQIAADVVVAFNVICRLDDPAAGMQRAALAVKPGGLLLIDDRSAKKHLVAYAEFQPLCAKTYRRSL